MKKYLLPPTGRFYKANLHCHTTISDGHLTPEEVKELYKRHGYSVVAFTDHDILIPHPELRDGDFLPLNSYEMEVNEPTSAPFSQTKTCHMCLIALEPDNVKQVCWHRDRYLFGNAPNYVGLSVHDDGENYDRVYSHEGVSDMMKRARENGFFVTYNHPRWSLENYADYIGYEGMNALEIANYSCLVGGFPEYDPQIYDDLLRAGRRIFCIAADDNHNIFPEDGPYCDSCGGFTMIKAEKLEYREITRALELGNFYASQGPEIRELWYEDGKLHVLTSPARKISFCCATRHTYSYYGTDENPITEAEYEIPKDAVYVRVNVVDEKGLPADSNAYFTDELER